MGEIDINGFSGANNIMERFFVERGIVEPRIILNADVDLQGRLLARKGKTLYISKSGAYSLWAGISCMLFVAGGVLYRIIGGEAVNVGTVDGPTKYPLSYAEADDKVYISGPYWQGIFDPTANSVATWGVPQPPGPMLSAGSGNLPAGTYFVTMTNVTNGELSGNGPISMIELASEGGIQVINRPSGALVWVTDSDEGILYLVGETSKIVDIPTVEPLPSFMCSPPPFLENLCYAFGRMWGSEGNTVYYSEPFKLGWFKLASNKFTFDSKITLIAKVSSGLFVGTKEKTVFLAGTEPDKMVQSDAGAGSIMGTLSYCNNLPDLGSVLGTPEKGFVDVPVWMTVEGIVAGNVSGKLFNLTKNKLKTGIPSRGAALYRNLEGVFQYLASFTTGATGSGKGFVDEETYNAFKNGMIDVFNRRANLMGSSAGFTDSATCTVTRGGVIV